MEQVAGNMGLFEGQPGAQVITMRPDLRCKGEYEFCREDAAVEHYSRRARHGALSKEGQAWSIIQGGPGMEHYPRRARHGALSKEGQAWSIIQGGPGMEHYPRRARHGALSKEGQAWSIIQGGPGMEHYPRRARQPILSRSHYLCLAGKAHKVDVEEGMRDIPDPDVKVKIEKVRSTGDFSYYNYSTPFCNANPTTLLQMRFLFAPQLFAETDADEYQGTIQDLGEWLVDLGIPSIGQKLDNRSALVRTLVMYFLCYRLVLRPIIMTLSLTLKYSTDVLILSFFSQEWNLAWCNSAKDWGSSTPFLKR